MTRHTHTCATPTCGLVWSCTDGRGAVCPVDRAARVNGTGPWCALCFHVQMARRHAAAQRIRLAINWPRARPYRPRPRQS